MRHLKQFKLFEAKYEELDNIADELVDSFMESIDKKTNNVESEMANSAQYVLQQVVDKMKKLKFDKATIKEFNEGLSYSGGDVTKMPIIGTITTKSFTWETPNGSRVIPGGTDKVVEIIEDGPLKIYILDRWYKGRTPQLVHADMVEKYTPNNGKVDQF